jgi:transcriptional regulator with XRE-family HTH domain
MVYMNDAQQFWKNVQEEIKNQKTTQESVSNRADINMYTFQGWISKGVFPRLDDAVRIAAVLNTTVEYFMVEKTRDCEKTLQKVQDLVPALESGVAALRRALDA